VLEVVEVFGAAGGGISVTPTHSVPTISRRRNKAEGEEDRPQRAVGCRDYNWTS